MGLTGSIIVYVMIWWVVFSFAMEQSLIKKFFQDKIEGIDPGAPKNPKSKKNFSNNYNYIYIVYCDILFD